MAGDCGQCDHEHGDGHEGHGGCEHGHAEGEAFLPPPPPRPIIPEFPMLWRGLALGGLSVGAIAGAVLAARQSLLLAVPVTPLAALAALLTGWAAAVHLTGGENFDDNPFV